METNFWQWFQALPFKALEFFPEVFGELFNDATTIIPTWIKALVMTEEESKRDRKSTSYLSKYFSLR